MVNPWKEISLSDYENHMSLDSVKQLQSLNLTMKEQFNDYDVNTVMIMGIALLSLHFIVGGSNFRDFCSGVLLGLSIGEMLVGVYVVARGLSKQQ